MIEFLYKSNGTEIALAYSFLFLLTSFLLIIIYLN